jgi:hypothetical protein
MSWTLDYAATDRILTVKCEGVYTADDLGPMTKAAIDKLHEVQSLRVLLDFSTAIAQLSVADVYNLPDIYSNSNAPRLAHLAMVVPKDNYRISIYQFYEDLCINRGFFVKLFNDTASAKSWLMEI